MYITDIIWWSYTAFLIAAAVFMLWFTFRVRKKGA